MRVSLLYQAVVPVSSQSTEERNQMVQQGLAQVLIKVTGNEKIADNPAVKPHLSTADQLLEQFSYSAAVPTNPQQPYLLHMDFDPEGVNKLLRSAGIPIWGQNTAINFSVACL